MQESKKNLRSKLKLLRQSMSPEEQILKSAKIARNLLATIYIKQNKNIGFYASIQGEVRTQELIEYALKNRKNCYLPILNQNIDESRFLTFGKFDSNTKLITNKYGILEPEVQQSEHFSGEDLDLLIVPLVGFDKHCHRLGYGGGYYDRTFAYKKELSAPPILIGIAYAFQELENIQVEPWDITLDCVITEQNTFSAK